ncbi:MAG: hypothetical protein QXP80_04085 [Zestosphaera sp.]
MKCPKCSSKLVADENRTMKRGFTGDRDAAALHGGEEVRTEGLALKDEEEVRGVADSELSMS